MPLANILSLPPTSFVPSLGSNSRMTISRTSCGSSCRNCVVMGSKPQCCANVSTTPCTCLPAAMDRAKAQSLPVTLTVSPLGSNCSITVCWTCAGSFLRRLTAESSAPHLAQNSATCVLMLGRWCTWWSATLAPVAGILCWMDLAKPRSLPMTFWVSSLGSNCSTSIAETAGGSPSSQAYAAESRPQRCAKASSSGLMAGPLGCCWATTDLAKAFSFPATSWVPSRGANSVRIVRLTPSSRELR
mmetsp:Transcript_93624/g.209686  ORF Transcript_93624/g.209686 Transcript_93624/m.209686 type:complete len:244 (+) Transcript_93624:154-885(+)